MIRIGQFGSQSLSKSQIILNLYSSIISLAVFSLVLGMQSVNLARDLGRGDPYHVLRWTELALCSAVVVVIFFGFLTHTWIQRLAKLDSKDQALPHIENLPEQHRRG